MFSDVVLERIAAVRHRFAAHLDDYIDEMSSPLLAADAAGTASLSQAYRRAHKLCGIGPTLGFVATGRRAREIEKLLRPATRSHRALNPEETAQLRARIAQLRAVAISELNQPPPRHLIDRASQRLLDADMNVRLPAGEFPRRGV
jgi:HPt (histidine-containing phosphotransfer) domain-containing protein